MEFHLVGTSRDNKHLALIFSFSTHSWNFSNLVGEDLTYRTAFRTLAIDSWMNFNSLCTIKFKICAQQRICMNSSPNMLLSLSFFLFHIINCQLIRTSIVRGDCKQLVYTPLQQTWLNRSTYGVPFVISCRAKVQDFLLVSPIPINEVCGD